MVRTNKNSIAWLVCWLMAVPCAGQAVQFPDPTAAAGGGVNPYAAPAFGAPPPAGGVPAPGAPMAAPAASPYAAPSFGGPPPTMGGATLGPGIQPFDPYALPTSSTTLPLPTATSPTGAPPPGAWPGMTPPPTGAPPGYPGAMPYGTPPPNPYGNPYPPAPGAAPNAAVVQPGSGPWPAAPPATPQTATTAPPPYRRLFERTGVRYTWLYGKEGRELQMHDVEISTHMNFANFLHSPHGLRVTPGFIFHFLGGPSPPVESHLPSRLYSAYLDFGYNPVLTPQFSGELSASIGVYSDFQTLTTQSARLRGKGLGVYRMNPQYALKAGVDYINRADLKLLPAFGILWTPNDQMRWDIYFPAPKLAHYWTTVGNTDLWYYLAGEYGGGTWTYDREVGPAAGSSELVDINDIRLMGGLEWSNANRYFGFFEIGYVFDREIVYVNYPEESVKLKDTFMLRAGISF